MRARQMASNKISVPVNKSRNRLGSLFNSLNPINSFNSLPRAALLLASVLLATGCLPSSQTQLDEEKEPHFLEGKRRLNARDYKGASESFEKAIQVNPQSASAHFELAVLCQQAKQDFAGAIYHFQHFLELRPRSDYAEIVKQKILACKQELARTVALGPVTQSMQHDFEQVVEENKRLRDELEACHANLTAFQQWRSNQTSTPILVMRAPQTINPRLQAAAPASNAAVAARAVPPAAPGARTHTIKPGETPTVIARKYGVRVDALMAANPNLDARRLQIGQTLNLPGQ